MSTSNNVNVSESVSTANNVNDNDRGKYQRSRQVDRVADEIIVRLGVAETYRAFYCKIAWKLSEARIYSNLEAALKGNQPARLFTYLCKKDMNG